MRTSARDTLLGVAVRALALSFPVLCFAQTTSPDDVAADKVSKKCDTLKRHIAKEQTSLAAFEQTIAQDKKGRESCSTKPMCARYDEAIKTIEARKAQHQARLEKFQADAANVCKAS